MKTRVLIITALLIAAIPFVGFAFESINDEDAFLKLVPNAEVGFTKVLNHTIQFGDGTTNFDYVKQGGQEILFLFQRYSLDVNLGKRHTVTLLYQPLTLETQTRVPTDLTAGITIDDVTFPAGTGLDLKYGFDFWRGSYLFSFINRENFTLAGGLSLQFRNASIVFETTEGDGITISQNLGPVPILKLKTEYRFKNGYFIGAEADGFYASSAIFNGADFKFTGWIYDAAIRGGKEINSAMDAYLSARILGGGATGDSEYVDRFWTEPASGYTNNNLTTLIFSGGFRLK
jgi:hypothetical protein